MKEWIHNPAWAPSEQAKPICDPLRFLEKIFHRKVRKFTFYYVFPFISKLLFVQLLYLLFTVTIGLFTFYQCISAYLCIFRATFSWAYPKLWLDGLTEFPLSLKNISKISHLQYHVHFDKFEFFWVSLSSPSQTFHFNLLFNTYICIT